MSLVPVRSFYALCITTLLPVLVCAMLPSNVRADAFDEYGLSRIVTLPASGGPADVLDDGRLIALSLDEVFVETGVGSGTFSLLGTLPSADISSYGAGFLRVSPDGTKIAVGNSGGVSWGNYEVGIFDLASLAGTWFTANHYEGAWIDDRYFALSAGFFGSPAGITALDTLSADAANPVNPTLIDNIGEASAGVAFDSAGNLFTGNGYYIMGPIGTGVVKAFGQASWSAAWSSGLPLDFATEGTFIVDILSASPLAFDVEGNLLVGGGDALPDADFAAIVRAPAVADALAGLGPVDVADPNQVRRLDPINAAGVNFYSIHASRVTGQVYLRDVIDPSLYVYEAGVNVPALSTWGVFVMGLLLLTGATLVLDSRSRKPLVGVAA